ncbi:MAG: hypothetical protein M0D55_08540 [Elusimicrobiota bacterium]|nr:MAG: hypothetical protein M0D55_08540 [Elusimicrobiota bacterium]
MTPASVRLSSVDETAFFCAAHALTDRAIVVVERSGKSATARLWPKGPGSGKSLAAEFRREYENQALRWRLTREGLGLRAETLRRALALAAAAGGRLEAPAASLTPAQKAEIAALLAEADADPGPRDPLGIATPWEDREK